MDIFRFFDRMGNVPMFVMELHVLLAKVMHRFGGSTCGLADSLACMQKEGEDNAAPNGVVSSSCGSPSRVRNPSTNDILIAGRVTPLTVICEGPPEDIIILLLSIIIER